MGKRWEDGYSIKEKPSDNDELMILSTYNHSNKRLLFSGLWSWAEDKISNSIVKQWIDAVNARIDNLAKLPAGSTTGDAEVADIRVAANGKSYATAGESVREQIKETGKKIDETAENLRSDIEKVKENVSETLKPADVQNAVDKYMESNTIDGIYTPDNLVLFEETQDEETITADTIIGAVLGKLDLRAIDEKVLGLYLDENLVASMIHAN